MSSNLSLKNKEVFCVLLILYSPPPPKTCKSEDAAFSTEEIYTYKKAFKQRERKKISRDCTHNMNIHFKYSSNKRILANGEIFSITKTTCMYEIRFPNQNIRNTLLVKSNRYLNWFIIKINCCFIVQVIPQLVCSGRLNGISFLLQIIVCIKWFPPKLINSLCCTVVLLIPTDLIELKTMSYIDSL